MTRPQLIIGSVVYAIALAAIVFVTRPTRRRFVGALVGATVLGGLGLAVLVPLGEAQGWWHVPLDPSPAFRTLLYVGTIVSTIPIFLVTWRIARRFGWRGLTLTFTVAALLGPVREFAVANAFPQWVRLTPSPATIIVLSLAYGCGFAAGHAIMRLVAGPAKASRLARWPWESSK